MKTIGILNGPNLDRLGKREPEIYGTETLKDLEALLTNEAKLLNCQLLFQQSNHEGILIDIINTWADQGIHGLVFNPAAYTHTSIALLDSIAGSGIPTIEVHLSDISKRESFRHNSITLQACINSFSGLGFEGYVLALRELV